MIHSVGGWWPEFVATTKKLDGVEEELSENRPLAGSVPVVEKQDKSAQVQALAHALTCTCTHNVKFWWVFNY